MEQTTSLIKFRKPRVDDAVAIWQLVEHSKVLCKNSLYSYLMLCRDFSETCIVAVENEQVVGFVTGYLEPEREDVLFVWQTAVDLRHRKKGIGFRMLMALLAAPACSQVKFLEATITKSNLASQSLFKSVATGLGAHFEWGKGYGKEDFKQYFVEEELRFRVGPIVNLP